MPRQINFLAERQKGISKQQLQDLRLMKIAGVVLGVVCLAGLIIFGLFFYFTYQLAQIRNQEGAIRGQILGAQGNEEAFVVYVKKLASLATIYKSREDKNNIIAYFSSLFGQDVVVTGIDFDQTDNLLHVKVEADDVFVLHRVLDLLNSDAVKAKFPALVSSNLDRNADATYEITITVPVTQTTG